MLRILGLVSLVVICIGMGTWGVLAGAILITGSLLKTRTPLLGVLRQSSSCARSKFTTAWKNLDAIPLVHAVYCANCDLISNSPHDTCRVCGSPSVISIPRMWQLTLPKAPVQSGTFKISFTADVRDIPANGLHESTKLIGRLLELGGTVKSVHIQVDSAPWRSTRVVDPPGITSFRKPLEPGLVRNENDHPLEQAS